jgi:hypothetical protein
MPEKGRYGVDYWNSAGIGAPGASGCKITNNILDWTGGTGIILRGGVNNCENNVISFNKLTNIGKAAIGIGIFNGGKAALPIILLRGMSYQVICSDFRTQPLMSITGGLQAR